MTVFFGREVHRLFSCGGRENWRDGMCVCVCVCGEGDEVGEVLFGKQFLG